jgi:hypothetical protein
LLHFVFWHCCARNAPGGWIQRFQLGAINNRSRLLRNWRDLYKAIFPALLEQCVRFYARTADGQNPIPDDESLTSLFISGATRFKHQGFQEEREVRVVAVPATSKILASELSKHPEYGSPDRWKHVHVRDVKRIRYIALLDTLNATLPIKRVIVGPSRNQDENYARARATIAEGVPVTRSATPFIG